MCGINLIFDRQNKVDASLISKMAENTLHRGPDETIIKTLKSANSTFHLAANRLKITDQTNAAAQPFMLEDQKHLLLFNGEIYNYFDLKNELLREGISFRSHSDTEVLFHWIRLFGISRLEELNGMFAFVYADIEKEELWMARDRFGIKPLYYYQDQNHFVISSELNSIMSSGIPPKKINKEQISHYLLYKYAKPPETFFKGVYALQPGNVLHHAKNEVDFQSFYTTPSVDPAFEYSQNDAEDLIRQSLVEQLQSDVPIGLLLSGGVDSTLLLAIAKSEGYTMPTFSIVNSKQDRAFGTADDRFARLASSTFQSDHHEIMLDIGILDQFDQMISKMDQPIGDSAYFMTSLISQEASKSVKVLLSGAGADELFGGYNRFQAFSTYLKNQAILKWAIPLARPIVNNLPTGFNYPLRKKVRLLQKWISSYDANAIKNFHNYITFDELRPLLHESDHQESHDQDVLEWAWLHDKNNYLINDVLALTDHASMQHGIEVRVPFLEIKIAEYISKGKKEQLLNHGPKWMLKKMLTDNGGKAFVNRPKEGFGLPLNGWLADKRAEHLWKPLFNKDAALYDCISADPILKFVEDRHSKRHDRGPLLWSILVLSHWLEANL